VCGDEEDLLEKMMNKKNEKQEEKK